MLNPLSHTSQGISHINFRDREEGRENVCIYLLIPACALTGDRTHNVGISGLRSHQLTNPARAVFIVFLRNLVNFAFHCLADVCWFFYNTVPLPLPGRVRVNLIAESRPFLTVASPHALKQPVSPWTPGEGSPGREASQAISSLHTSQSFLPLSSDLTPSHHQGRTIIMALIFL